MNQNRIWNASNPNQGSFKKVLCVCSAGLLRSPTAARILSMPPFNFNTRAVGLDFGHALIPLEGVHLHWADVVVCMNSNQKSTIKHLATQCDVNIEIHNLNIPDEFRFRDPALEKMITDKCLTLFGIPETNFEPIENADTQEC